MNLFKFVKREDEERISPRHAVREVITSLDAFEQSKKKQEGQAVRSKREEAASKKKADLDAPFAFFSGDPTYNALTNPSAEPPKFEFVHKSLEAYSGESKRGVPYARHLKTLLRGASNDYQRIDLEPSHYEAYLSSDQKKLIDDHFAKNPVEGRTRPTLEAYIPKSLGEGKPKYLTKFYELARKNLKTPKGTATSEDTSASNDPVALVSKHGPRAVASMFDFDAPYGTMSEDTNDKNCIFCRRPEHEHTDAKEAKRIFESTGKSLESHDFVKNHGQSMDDVYAQSSLAQSLRPVRQKNGSYKLEPAKAYDESDPRKGSFLPMIRIGAKAGKLTRFIGRENSKNPTNFDLKNEAKSACPGCREPNSGESTGKKDTFLRENSCRCNDCINPGHVNYKETIGEDGQPTLTPYTVAVGHGKVKYLNDSDADICPTCNGEGEVYNNKSATHGTVCRNCEGIGHVNRVVDCHNCGSSKSQIKLTGDNTCLMCKGKKIIDKSTNAVRRLSGLFRDQEDHEGNIRFTKELKSSDPSGFLWKGHGDKDCHVCHGDDEYQTEYGFPCNCRIAGPEYQLAVPGDTKVISRKHVNIPEAHYDKLMGDEYGEINDSPHSIEHIPTTVDARKPEQSSMDTWGIGDKWQFSTGGDAWQSRTSGEDPIDGMNVTGTITPGKRMPKETLETLKNKSKKNHASKNAKFCAASADLEDVLEEMHSNFHRYPDNIVGKKALKKTKRRNSRIDVSSYPEEIQSKVSDTERTLQSLPDAWNGRYNRLADMLYNHASALTRSSEPEKNPSYSKFIKARERLTDVVGRFNGEEAKNEVASKLNDLGPSTRNSLMPVGKPTDTNALQEGTNV